MTAHETGCMDNLYALLTVRSVTKLTQCILLVSNYPLSLLELQCVTQALAYMAVHLGTKVNCLHQAKVYTDLCNQYNLQFMNPSSATVC